VCIGEAIVVHPFKIIEMDFDQTVKRRGFGIAGAIDAADAFCQHILVS
jgi:hypothetical protein